MHAHTRTQVHAADPGAYMFLERRGRGESDAGKGKSCLWGAAKYDSAAKAATADCGLESRLCAALSRPPHPYSSLLQTNKPPAKAELGSGKAYTEQLPPVWASESGAAGLWSCLHAGGTDPVRVTVVQCEGKRERDRGGHGRQESQALFLH